MIQHDYTAPELAVKVSRKEHFRLAFSLFTKDEQHPDTSVVAANLRGDLLDASGTRLNGASMSMPEENVVMVDVSTRIMNSLRPGRYRLELYQQRGDEREDMVVIMLAVE
ncbi:hypothetical protein [Spirosoma oryzicola]|uniref:hypothetical protein n=1 Tax=Spirosoma oryzicola TaxID=2898794 RepID=UPI001E2985ED|nr:hypothetical protein [Spirosoma oryzicola]UHG93323.1 hypothetical protein LQ777_10565 [Spirosoma oryzicola]